MVQLFKDSGNLDMPMAKANSNMLMEEYIQVIGEITKNRDMGCIKMIKE